MRLGHLVCLVWWAFLGCVPAIADKGPALARITWPEGHLPPARIHVAPPSVSFGEVVVLVVDAEPGTALPSAEALVADVDWLVPDLMAPMPDLADLPHAAGPRIVLPMRIYHLGPWRLAWGDSEIDDALTVQGRLAHHEEIMPVRDPRSIGGVSRWLAWGLVVAAVLVVVLLLLRRLSARRKGVLPADRLLAPPAWLSAALQLRDLDRLPAMQQDAGRAFLDRLAHILRAYMQGRYHLPALEMTAEEILETGRAAGWPFEQLERFCGLLTASDHLRYAPTAVTALSCREFTGKALDLIEDVRIDPVWSPVPPGMLAEATAAWNELRTRYPRRTVPLEPAAC